MNTQIRKSLNRYHMISKKDFATSGSIQQTAWLCLAMLATVGCSDFEASFSISENTRSLAAEAQNGTGESPGVIALTEEKFGNPQSLKAWTKLPVNWGGTSVSVAAVGSDGDAGTSGESAEVETADATETPESGDNKVTLQVPDESISLPNTVSSLLVSSGESAGQSVAVTSWDASTGEAILATKLVLSAGDQCTLDAGKGLQEGRVLYMRHCSHCHGTAGDGNGPTAQYLNPRPRDYRHGVFKFTSTNDMSRASRNDLTRVLRYGIPGTYMPSFLLMEDDELEAIVEYVRFLAMRGEFERKLVVELSSDYSKDAMVSRIEGGETRDEIVEELAEFLELDMPESVDYVGNDLQEIWTAAETEEARVIPTVARVPDTAESRRRGRELYLSKTLNCADCHGIDGAGNGPQTMAFEKNPITNEKYSEPGLHDVWDNLNQPRNLQAGIFRGGRRPIDIFCRVYSGIKGSRMPSFKNTPHEDIWHIVNYVLSLPFESDPGATGSLASSEVAGGAEAGD